MSGRNFLHKIRLFDAYPKTLEEFRVKTFAGAAVTIFSGFLIVLLFLSELSRYLTLETKQELFVDTSRDQKVRINMNVIFPHIPCHSLSIDAMDISGEQQQSELEHHLFKQRLDKDGNRVMNDGPTKSSLGDPSKDIDLKEVIEKAKNSSSSKASNGVECQSCYGAETRAGQCCNTCDQVKEAYRKKGWAMDNLGNIDQCKGEAELQQLSKDEGCQAYGYLLVNKVAGNFHFAPGKSFVAHHVHIHDLGNLGADKKFNLTHRITHLSFGQDYPGIVNPLDRTDSTDQRGSTMYQYYVKIVPTTYDHLDGSPSLYTNQYSVTKHEKQVSLAGGDAGLPGVFVHYEFSPMMVKVSERAKSFLHFLTSVCAIVGGVFTVAGLFDSLLYHSARYIQKSELGKLG